MLQDNFTQTPNIVFDKLLKELNTSELKILLVIIRQTYGWINNKTKKRKTKDQISQSQFRTKTGLSRRIISKAINDLNNKELITITDSRGNILNTPKARKGKKIYYTPNLLTFRHQHVQKVIHNKINYNKRKINNECEIDFKHIGEVITEEKINWNISKKF